MPFIPMPMHMPKPVCITCSNNQWVQYEICITFLSRGMSMNITAQGRLGSGRAGKFCRPRCLRPLAGPPWQGGWRCSAVLLTKPLKLFAIIKCMFISQNLSNNLVNAQRSRITYGGRVVPCTSWKRHNLLGTHLQ